jgi:rod shape determining protein RodA
MHRWFLPACYFIFALLSVQTLSSVAPQLSGRQLISFVLGAVLFYIFSKISFQQLLQVRWFLYVAAIIILLIPLFLFDPTRGTHRWIDIGGVFTIQSSQLALPLTIFVLVSLFTKAKHYSWAVLCSFLFLLAIPAGLILIAPDLGSTLAYALPLMALILIVPFSWKKIGTLAVLGVFGVIFAWHFILEPYQKVRFMSFLNPESSDNYNAHQALITVGSGKLMGRGLGQGIQSHLRFLPERQTDFIFASFAEEYGFFGCLVLVGAYGGLIYYLFLSSRSVHSPEAKMYLIVLASALFLQASINIHMNLGLLPITGITLPLMSYGGSSILSLAIMLGVSQNIVQGIAPKQALHIS